MCRRIAIPALFLASSLCLCSTASYAQAAEISAIANGRPSIYSGTDLIPVGVVQFENGFSWSNDGHSKTLDGPESLLRIGLTSRVELQVALPNVHLPGLGSDDLALGAKVRIGSNTHSWPIAAVGAISLPTGSAELTSGGADPSLFLETSHDFSHAIQFSGGLGVASLSEAGGARTTTGQLALDLGWCVRPETCMFVEEAPFAGTGTGNSGFTSDAGMSLRLVPRLPFDWRIGTTIQSGESTFFVSFGYSFRRTRVPVRMQAPPRPHSPANYPRLAADSSRERTP